MSQTSQNSSPIQINSYQELDELIARKLGWVESWFEEECSRDTPGAIWSFGTDSYVVKVELLYPSEIVERGSKETWVDFHQEWCYDNGGAPLFSRKWQDTELLLDICDKASLLVEWFRNEEVISCSIDRIENGFTTGMGVRYYTGNQFEIPKSMPLATCLAWLCWQGVKVNLNLQEPKQPTM